MTQRRFIEGNPDVNVRAEQPKDAEAPCGPRQRASSTLVPLSRNVDVQTWKCG